MAPTKGNCFVCGKETTKASTRNHLKTHAEGTEECILIKAEGTYDKEYWIYFTVDIDATLEDVDHFLRMIWCECCWHLSGFYIGREKLGMKLEVADIPAGVATQYQYDFGSTTYITMTVIDWTVREPQPGIVQVLARNIAPDIRCEKCGEPATQYNTWENEVICDKCIRKAAREEEDGDESVDEGNEEDNGDKYDYELYEPMLPIVNSPRCGVCGYCGDHDNWEFDATLFEKSEPRKPIKAGRKPAGADGTQPDTKGKAKPKK